MIDSIKEHYPMNKKRISVSQKRQITIPVDFFNKLGIENEVECYIQNGSIIVRPVHENAGGEFSEQILSDLISQGLSGEKLLNRFKEVNRQIRPAVEKMLEEAEQIAKGQLPYASYEDVFGSEN